MKNRTRLLLNGLENRLTPAATVNFLGGNLTVTGDNTANIVNISGESGAVAVNVNSVAMGTYKVTGSISVNAGNSADIVLLTINTGKSLPGNVTINTGNSNDTVNIVSAGGGFGTITGNLTLNTGSGDDVVNVAVSDADASVAVQGFTIMDGGIGQDAFNSGFFGQSDVKFANLTILTRVNNFTSDGKAPDSSAFLGTFVMNAASEALNASWFPNNTTFGGSVTVLTGAGDDNVYPIFGTTFASHVVFSVGNGNNNSVNFGNNNFNGNFTYLGGNGNDFLNNNEPHAGNVYLYLGDGDNTVFDGSQVNGSYSVVSGSGMDNVNLALTNFSANGRMDLNLGNGSNTLTFSGLVTGPVIYNGGGGSDNVIIDGVMASSFRAYLGAGADVLAFTTNGSVGSATFDFGVDVDIDSYAPPVLTGFNVLLVNYP